MKRIPLTLFMLFCTIIPNAQANTSQGLEELIDRFQLFTACEPMSLLVEELPEDAKKIKLTEKAITNSVDSKLPIGRILYKESAGSQLYVNVSVVKSAFNINLEFRRFLDDPRFPELFGMATTWNQTIIGQHGGSADYILSTLSRMVDEFLAKYLRVNEEACNTVR